MDWRPRQSLLQNRPKECQAEVELVMEGVEYRSSAKICSHLFCRKNQNFSSDKCTSQLFLHFVRSDADKDMHAVADAERECLQLYKKLAWEGVGCYYPRTLACQPHCSLVGHILSTVSQNCPRLWHCEASNLVRQWGPPLF